MRLYVERNRALDTKAARMEREIRGFLKMEGLERVRSIVGYEVQGLEDAELAKLHGIFANAGQDTVTTEVALDTPYFYITRYLDHQYDQSVDVCEMLIKLQYPDRAVRVKTLEIIALYGDVALDTIKQYYINPLEKQEVSLDEPFNWGYGSEEPQDVAIIEGFSAFGAAQLADLRARYGISMNEQDMAYTQEYYKKEAKDPTITELKILDTYWSDHCRHSTFQTMITDIEVSEEAAQLGVAAAQKQYEAAHALVYTEERPHCLMDMATMEMKKLKKQGILTNLEDSEEVNACSIEVSGDVDGKREDFILMFKNETHNHPTEMEPFGGAGTCIGGGIRDPLSGRSYVFGAMRITGAADPRAAFADTMPGKIPQRNLTKTAADGYSDYGNQIGLASGYLNEFYHEGFKAKRMECGALVAFNYKKNITRGNAEPGDAILMMGGPTGRDGLGGAVGSSNEASSDAKNYSAEVQKGNPIEERNIIRLYKRPDVSVLIKKSNDFGAGGVSVAIGEMANSLNIELDKVPLKYRAMDATEVAISESQERMAILVAAKDVPKVLAAAKEENVPIVQVATVTDDQRMVMTYRGKTVCDLDTSFLNSGGVRQSTTIRVEAPQLKAQVQPQGDLKAAVIENLKDLNVCSKKIIANQFDKALGAQTVLYPFGGKYMATAEQGLAMRLPLEEGSTDLGAVMTVGYDPHFSCESTFHAAYYAVLESILRAVSMGARLSEVRLSFQEFFEKMASKEAWGKVYSALLGAFVVQDTLSVPSIGGKDSMSGTYKDINVPPSLLSFAVAPVDTTKLVSKAFKQANSRVYLIEPELGADRLPTADALKASIALLEQLIAEGKVRASSVVGAGGISAEIAKMALGNRIGFELAADFTTPLFGARYHAVLIETTEELDLPLVGVTTSAATIDLNGARITLEEAKAALDAPLSTVFEEALFAPKAVAQGAEIKAAKPKAKAKPVALLPIFPGTNGEYTLARQLKLAGFEVKEELFRRMDIAGSYQSLAQAIDAADLMVLPSGMSGGGKPNGAAKYISMLLSQADVKAAVNRLIDRKGLVMGLGEGFKALVVLGMIEHGRIADKTDSLDITTNPLDRHYADLFETRVVNAVAPYYSAAITEILPFSTTEGCVRMSAEDFARYSANGQIVSVFASANPYGSEYGIEAMVSANGQVFGKLGELTQVESGLYTNVFDAQNTSVFENMKQHWA